MSQERRGDGFHRPPAWPHPPKNGCDRCILSPVPGVADIQLSSRCRGYFMGDIIKAATSGDIVLLLAIIVVILGGVVGTLFWLLIKEMRGRVTRAEELTDRANDLFDRLETSTNTAVAVARDNAEVAKRAADLAQNSLDELRKR